jgi:thymidylate synthase (FAD)
MIKSIGQIQVELQDVYGSDRHIAEAAWTSSLDYQKKQKRSEEDVKRVVNMLADLKHSTPFESVIFRFWIKMPIAIDRQFMTHRLQSPSGMSGRYRTMPSEYLYIPEDVDNILINKLQNLEYPNNTQTKFDVYDEYYRICEQSNNFYQLLSTALRLEEKKGTITNEEFKRLIEFFRGALPQHNMTERTTVINLRSWSNFIKLRNSEHAQKEIQQVAQLMLETVKESNKCSIAIDALERNNWTI